MSVTNLEDELELLKQVRDGDADALGKLTARHRERLSTMVRLRLDYRIQARVSPSDVIQDTFLDAARRIQEYLQDPGARSLSG